MVAESESPDCIGIFPSHHCRGAFLRFVPDFGMGMAGLGGKCRQNNASLPDKSTRYFGVDTIVWLMIAVGVFTLLLGIGFVLPMVFDHLGPGSPGQ